MNMTQSITATRAAIGVSCWATPVLASRIFGVDVRNDRSAKFYLKLGGTRDLALAAGSGTIPVPGKAQALRIAAACDVADMIATVITRREGDVTKLGTGLWLVASGACLTMTIAAIREQQQ
jgi:hypothetical protein